MARKERDDVALIWGASGAIVLWRLAPGVLYVIGLGNFDGPFEDGPMSDFDREIAAHASLELFIDVRKVERGSRKSREAWKEWAGRNNARHRSHVLVRSSLLHMAISVIALASGTSFRSYSGESEFLAELKRKVTGLQTLPTVPAWVPLILKSDQVAV